VSSFKFIFILNFTVFNGVRIPLPDGQDKFIQESCTSATDFLHRALKMKVKMTAQLIF